ncbi:colicin immunity domain-containing protein [Klebsiella aerogenes]|uniref:Colicin-D n=1 Tax=Klebsiella aerogenes TaxID=548 RepID=A0AAP9R1X6_KLEAE|nr:colicin immunity domain-containing protein [Klebsiella aerogenes]QMR42848.1 colicin-D [Klebsiella aerogenes]
MSRMKLIELGREFLKNNVTADEFVDGIIKERRALYGTEEDNKDINHCGGELFIIADCYNPESDRDSYELDEVGLRREVKSTLEKFNLL